MIRTSGVEQLVITAHSDVETRQFGATVARCVRGGELIGLQGDLGAGKTVFVRGLAEGLGIASTKVRSPTFTLVNEYSGGRLPFYHLDLYRVEPTDMDRLALREYLHGVGVCAVEWIERLGEDPPRLNISFTFVGENERKIVVAAQGEGYDALLVRIQDGLESWH